jgi:hypothetical protein
MTAGMSATNLANAILNHLRGGTTWTAPAGLYVKLHTGDPGSAGANNAAAGSTTRVQATFGTAASGGSISMTGTAPSWTNGGTSETISYISVWDASTAGNFLFSAALTASQAWASTNTLTLSTFTISFTPIAA